MKVIPIKLKESDKAKYLNVLHVAAVSLKSSEEIELFLKDLLTESEKIMIGRRILIAKRLLENKSYNQIVEEMGVGMDTVVRVHRWLEDESRGYEAAVGKLDKQRQRGKNSNNPIESGWHENESTSFKGLRKKYPLHFLLVNLFLDKKNQ